jgi:hypothetical protein
MVGGKMTKEDIEEKLFNDDLNLEELLPLKEEMKKHSFSNSDLQYIDELILEKIDLIEDINTIKELKNKYSNFDTSLFDIVINRRELLKTKEIEKMTKDEIEYLYENELHNFDIVNYFRLLTVMKKYKFSRDDLNYIIELIKDEIDSIEYKDYYDLLSKLNNIKMHCFKYRCDTSILNKYIDYVKKKNKSGVSFGKILFWTAIGALGDSVTHNNPDGSLMSWEVDAVKNGYESFNFEEEELEEDDYYSDDLD